MGSAKPKLTYYGKVNKSIENLKPFKKYLTIIQNIIISNSILNCGEALSCRAFTAVLMTGPLPGTLSLFFKDGVYHLLHLSCPGDSLGTQYPYRCTTSQRHVTSRDLVHWEEKPIALKPGPDEYDVDGAWTGSMVEKGGKYYLFYTGHHAGGKESAKYLPGHEQRPAQFHKIPAQSPHHSGSRSIRGHRLQGFLCVLERG